MIPGIPGAIASAAGPVGGLIGDLMAQARQRRLAEAQGMAQAAQVQAQGESEAAVSQSDRERKAFENMMASYGQALGK